MAAPKGHKGRRRTHTPSAEQIDQERKVLELRRAGVTLPQIATQLNTTTATASRTLKRALARTLQEPAQELRDLEADRLDRLQVAVWAQAMRGDLGAVDRVLKVMERRTELLGLDHKHGALDRALALEADKVRLMAAAFGRALDQLNLTDEQRTQAAQTLIEELRTATSDDDVLELTVTPESEPT